MPIKRELRFLYPIDWRELSAVIRFERAQSRCERCRRPHGEEVLHLGDGRWWDAASGTWRNGQGRPLRKLPPPQLWNDGLLCTRVVLACAHLDHDPTNNHPRNLAALCQRCHMVHDRERAPAPSQHHVREASSERGPVLGAVSKLVIREEARSWRPAAILTVG